MKIGKWFLKNKKWLRRVYVSAYAAAHIVAASIALVWVSAVGCLISSIPPLSQLPRIIPTYILVGIGFVLFILCIIGLIFICSLVTEKWWEWAVRSVRRRVRDRILDLEHDEYERLNRENARRREEERLLQDLKNSTWEV